MQHVVLGGAEQKHGVVEPTMMMTKEAMEHLVLEEELELQLDLLMNEIEKPETENDNVFSEVEAEMDELPHLKDASLEENEDVLHAVEDAIHQMENTVHQMENTVAMQEPAFLEENNLEALAICLVVLALAVSPELVRMLQ